MIPDTIRSVAATAAAYGFAQIPLAFQEEVVAIDEAAREAVFGPSAATAQSLEISPIYGATLAVLFATVGAVCAQLVRVDPWNMRRMSGEIGVNVIGGMALWTLGRRWFSDPINLFCLAAVGGLIGWPVILAIWSGVHARLGLKPNALILPGLTQQAASDDPRPQQPASDADAPVVEAKPGDVSDV